MNGEPPTADPWCRSRSLERTAAILSGGATRFGVSRLGSITRLDGVGLSTVTAVRRDPIGESISVCTGKGATDMEARVGALAEALERYCAEPRDRVPVVTARLDEQPDAIAPDTFILPDDAAREGAIDWCRAATLGGRAVWVPANAVFFPYVPSAGARVLFAPQTTGLAAGATLDEALVFALLECIERDAYSRALGLASVGRGEEIPVMDPDAVQAAAPQEFGALRSRGIDLLVRDLTCDTAVPCFLCTINDGSQAHFGAAARPNAVLALRHAMQEAAQSRLTDIQGAREDLPDHDPTVAVDPWFTSPGGARIVDADGAQTVLAGLDARLKALTPPVEACGVDLTLSGVDMAVVRALTPGLEVWALDPSRVGARLRSWWQPAP
jgi:ribosomal protein S12 methylthiotransferase accessory factor